MAPVPDPSPNSCHSDRFAWLLGESPPLLVTEPDPQEFIAACEFALSYWHVVPIVGPKLFAWGSKYLDSPQVSQIRDLIISAQVFAQVQLSLCRRFTQELDKRQIPYTLLKGIAVRLTAYPEPNLRCGFDIDIGVPSKYLKEAEAVALDQGYHPSALDISRRHYLHVDPIERQLVEANHYELGSLVRRQVILNLEPEVQAAITRTIPRLIQWHTLPDDNVACYIALDIHHGLCLDIKVEPVVASAQQLTFGSYSTRVPRLEWSIFHLIYKIYWEGVHNYNKGVYQYADLIRLVPQLQSRATSALLDLLAQYRLEAAGYYVLRRLESDFSMSLSPELRSFVADAAKPPPYEYPLNVNDMGDMWPKVWGYR